MEGKLDDAGDFKPPKEDGRRLQPDFSGEKPPKDDEKKERPEDLEDKIKDFKNDQNEDEPSEDLKRVEEEIKEKCDGREQDITVGFFIDTLPDDLPGPARQAFEQAADRKIFNDKG